MTNALRALQDLGIDIDDGIVERLKQELAGDDMPDIWRILVRARLSDECFLTYSMLQLAGMGNYDEETGEWTPTSHKVYSFDAEFYDIGHMYTLFLQGVQAIVPDVEITDIQEDLSHMTDTVKWPYTPDSPPVNGTRSVSFACNGHPYSVTLPSWLDWINTDIIPFMNDVLEKEGCPGRLYVVSDDLDQIVIMIYGAEAQADALRPYATDK